MGRETRPINSFTYSFSRERIVAIFDELIQEMMDWYPQDGYGLWDDVLVELRNEVAIPAEKTVR